MEDVRKVDVAIIGAGFGGIGMGIALKRRGLDNFVIFEGSDEVGGSWAVSRYPGCACDVPSHLYSYSFEPNPRWSQAYSTHTEINNYIEHCAEKYGVGPHISFDSAVSDATFQESEGIWNITLSDGRKAQARVLIGATGALSLPKLPDIDGIELYRGEQLHSANWDDSITLENKRVAVIGTGASAIQVVPSIADKVKQLFVFQRTASWVLPKRNRNYSDLEQKIWARFPLIQKLSRYGIYWAMEMAAPALIWFPSFLKVGKMAHRSNLNRAISDPLLRRKLTPEYELGCKRTLVSDDYFPAFRRKHVELLTDGIATMNETGFVTNDGRQIEVDTVIYTTGYDVGQSMFHFTLHGRNGTSLEDDWNGQPKAYYGMNISGYPNLGLIMGPNAGPGHTSVLVYDEAQFKYLAAYASHILRENITCFDVKEEEMIGMFNWAQKRMKNTTWSSGCASWYLNEDGTNSTMWPGFSFEYIFKTRRLRVEAYTVS